MLGEWFADLDELVLLCRDKEAKKYIAEAVACYRAGAFRACIVASWTAVVYDFIHKLRELELTGDANARKRLGEFETIRVNANIPAALVFERTVLDMAKDEFEFLTLLEHIDLVRLLEDRNRCAHPSMNSSEDAYQPSAEMTRYHLRSAVTHMLQHPPVQGKAALDKLINDVFSQYFPNYEISAAIAHFKQGPLARPRPALVRNFVIILMKALLVDADKIAAQYKVANALEAVRVMHPAIAETAIYEKINDMMRNLGDADMSRGMMFLHLVSDMWTRLAPDVQSRLKSFVQNMPETDLYECLVPALLCDTLKREVDIRLAQVTSMTELVRIARELPIREVLQQIVTIYLQSNSFAEARRNGSLLGQITDWLDLSYVEQIIRGASENNQITGGGAFPDLVRQIQASKKLTDAQLAEFLDKYDFQAIREKLIFKEESDSFFSDPNQVPTR